MKKSIAIIDSHAHLADESLYSEHEELINKALLNGVESIININTDQITLKRGLLMSEKFPMIFNTGATTPHDVATWGERDFPFFEAAARKKELVALGETGLDYYYEHADRKTQHLYLRKYFALAVELNLPLVIHCRDAFEDLFAIAKEYDYPPAVLHCFTGTLRDAKFAIDQGWMVSISGIVTFKRSVELQAVVKKLPLDRLLIETDSPYLAPVPMRGKRNEPSFILETANFIAKLHEIDIEQFAKITRDNTIRFFHLEKKYSK